MWSSSVSYILPASPVSLSNRPRQYFSPQCSQYMGLKLMLWFTQAGLVLKNSPVRSLRYGVIPITLNYLVKSEQTVLRGSPFSTISMVCLFCHPCPMFPCCRGSSTLMFAGGDMEVFLGTNGFNFSGPLHAKINTLTLRSLFQS